MEVRSQPTRLVSETRVVSKTMAEYEPALRKAALIVQSIVLGPHMGIQGCFYYFS